MKPFDLKESVSVFLSEYGYGDTVRTERIARFFLGVEPPMDGTNDGFGMPLWKVEFLNRLGAFEAELLKEHDILMVAKGHGSRIIIHPSEQGEISIRKFQEELKAAMHKLNLRLTHVNVDRLTPRESSELTDQRIYRDRLQERLRLSTRQDESGVKHKRLFRITG